MWHEVSEASVALPDKCLEGTKFLGIPGCRENKHWECYPISTISKFLFFCHKLISGALNSNLRIFTPKTKAENNLEFVIGLLSRM